MCYNKMALNDLSWSLFTRTSNQGAVAKRRDNTGFHYHSLFMNAHVV